MLVLKTDESAEQIVHKMWYDRVNTRVETAREGFLEEALPKLRLDRAGGIRQAFAVYLQVVPPVVSP